MTDPQKWHALARNSKAHDGLFFYGVTTTGIFCRPSCKSRTPLPRHVVYFHDAEAALQAGFRPCKRCRPELARYHPQAELALRIREAAGRCLQGEDALEKALSQIGVSPRHGALVFKRCYGQSLHRYQNECRLARARELLAKRPDPVAALAFEAGFSSLSAFYRLFARDTGQTPQAYRNQHQPKESRR